MKLTYWVQITLSCVIVLLANVASTVLHHWSCRSLGFIICGLLWLFHPVLPKGAKISKCTLLWSRLAGIALILIGAFTRVNY